MTNSNQPRRLFITFTAGINGGTVHNLIQQLQQFDLKRTPEIYLSISTGGGDIIYGMLLYNFLRTFADKLVTHNIGNVDSIGNAIFLAANKEKRFAYSHAKFMFHGVTIPWQGNMSEADLNYSLQTVKTQQDRITNIITQSTTITKNEADELFKYQQYKTAQEALKKGIIYDIKEAIPLHDDQLVLIT